MIRHAAPGLLGDANMRINGLRADGSDFPLEATLSATSVAGLTVVVMRDVALQRETEEKMSRLAQYDSLTGLPNRALFMDRLAMSLVRARRNGQTLALLFVDLDGFKGINDSHGHREGDAVLVETARRLSAAVRRSDTVARLAGDEFTIILENLISSEADAEAITAKIVGTMREPFMLAGSTQVRVSASIGLVVHAASDGDLDVSELLKRADDAMYDVKRDGKDGYRLFVAAT